VIDIDDVKYESVDQCKTETKDDIKVDNVTSDYEDDSDIEVISEVKSAVNDFHGVPTEVEHSEDLKIFTTVKEKGEIKDDSNFVDDIEILIDDSCDKDENVESSNIVPDRFRSDENDCNNDDANDFDNDALLVEPETSELSNDTFQDDDVELITTSPVLPRPIPLDSLQT